jgi:hypothetical protein
MIFDDYSYLVQGDEMPDVQFTSIENGQNHRLKKGHIVLINFFIIPCKHCKKMLEYLQEEIWPEFQESKRLLLAVGREHTPEEIRTFRDTGNYILPFAADPDRQNYEKFAEKKVPRNYLFDSFGRLVYQTRGFDLDQMATLRVVLEDLEQE